VFLFPSKLAAKLLKGAFPAARKSRARFYFIRPDNFIKLKNKILNNEKGKEEMYLCRLFREQKAVPFE